MLLHISLNLISLAADLLKANSLLCPSCVSLTPPPQNLPLVFPVGSIDVSCDLCHITGHITFELLVIFTLFAIGHMTDIFVTQNLDNSVK